VRALLAALDRVRAAGYADPAAADPDDWSAPTCPCHAEDARRLRALAAGGHRLRGQAATLHDVAVTAETATRIEAAVTDALAAYTELDPRGRVVARWPATGPRTWRVTLVRVGGRWLLGAVARAP
jgi:hypothetical protein